MKRKNFKYILIFLFIVCLLIPISCINIFAVDYGYYYNSFNNKNNTLFSQLYFYNISNITINNNNYSGDIMISSRLQYHGAVIFLYQIVNGQELMKESIYNNGGATFTRLSYFDNITIDYNDNTYFKLELVNDTSNSNNLTGYGSYINESTNYNLSINDNNKYIYGRMTNTYSTAYLFEFNIKLNYISSSISFDKTYNLSFYNNDILYNSITISGASASGYAPFEEISQIKYGNTIVYDNSTWSSGYNSTLRYNQLMTQPNVTILNSDCNSIITFNTQSFVATETITNRYQLETFYNDSGGDVPYSDIYITGTVASGTTSPFITISEIKYNNTSVYSNGSFYSGYSSTLYSYSNNPLNLTTINSDANNIVTFINLSLGTYVPLNDILSGIAGVFGVTTTLIASAQTNWILAIFMAMSVFMLLVLVIFKFVRGNSSGGSK